MGVRLRKGRWPGPVAEAGGDDAGPQRDDPSASGSPAPTVASIFSSVARLYNAAFLAPPPLPEGSPSAPGPRDDPPDWRPPPRPVPVARPLPVAPLPPGSPRMLVDDDWAETPYEVPIPAPRIVPVACAAMPEGSLRPSVRGSAHGRAKLDEPRVAEMKRLRAMGWLTGRLAREFGVARNTVCYAPRARPGATSPQQIGGTS